MLFSGAPGVVLTFENGIEIPKGKGLNSLVRLIQNDLVWSV